MENLNENSNLTINRENYEKKSNEQQVNFDANNLEYGSEIRKMLTTAGTLELTKKQNEILYAPVKDSDVYIKPDGLIYLSWIKYSSRLTSAFTGTGWAMIPQGMPKILNDLVVWGFHLVIKGVYCGFSIGEQQYFANGRMSYGEACEGAKSNALMRLCKNLGIGLELWDKSFIDRWLSLYASKKWDDEKRKYIWSIKPNAFNENQNTAPQPVQTQNTAPQPIQAQNIAHQPVQTQNTAPQPIINTNIEKKSISENKDFLNQSEVKVEEPKTKRKSKKIVAEDVPMEEIKESEISNLPNYQSELESAKTVGQLKQKYEMIKKAFERGEITEANKESLRSIANKLFVKIASNENQ